jgi:hypothetical protein
LSSLREHESTTEEERQAHRKQAEEAEHKGELETTFRDGVRRVARTSTHRPTVTSEAKRGSEFVLSEHKAEIENIKQGSGTFRYSYPKGLTMINEAKAKK